MISREEYVAKLKTQIDQWNAEMAKWEAKATQAGEKMQAQYHEQLVKFEAKRDEALAEMHRLQSASAEAWKDMMRGAENAMKSWQEAFDKYRQIPQYKLLNRGMSLSAFKAIYWWEWTHRFLARLVGAAFLLPFLYFLARGLITRALLPKPSPSDMPAATAMTFFTTPPNSFPGMSLEV